MDPVKSEAHNPAEIVGNEVPGGIHPFHGSKQPRAVIPQANEDECGSSESSGSDEEEEGKEKDDKELLDSEDETIQSSNGNLTSIEMNDRIMWQAHPCFTYISSYVSGRPCGNCKGCQPCGECVNCKKNLANGHSIPCGECANCIERNNSATRSRRRVKCLNPTTFSSSSSSTSSSSSSTTTTTATTTTTTAEPPPRKKSRASSSGGGGSSSSSKGAKKLRCMKAVCDKKTATALATVRKRSEAEENTHMEKIRELEVRRKVYMKEMSEKKCKVSLQFQREFDKIEKQLKRLKNSGYNKHKAEPFKKKFHMIWKIINHREMERLKIAKVIVQNKNSGQNEGIHGRRNLRDRIDSELVGYMKYYYEILAPFGDIDRYLTKLAEKRQGWTQKYE
jgi:hypothetical protein